MTCYAERPPQILTRGPDVKARRVAGVKSVGNPAPNRYPLACRLASTELASRERRSSVRQRAICGGLPQVVRSSPLAQLGRVQSSHCDRGVDLDLCQPSVLEATIADKIETFRNRPDRRPKTGRGFQPRTGPRRRPGGRTRTAARTIVVLDMRELTPVFDYFVDLPPATAAGSCTRSARTSTTASRTTSAKPRMGIEGYAREPAGSCSTTGRSSIHIFDAETREFYALEDLWTDAKSVSPCRGHDEGAS